MKKNVTRKNLLRTIRGSLGRYLAILAIIALGAAMFVGLLITKSDMVATGQAFMDAQNMFDLRLLSTYGWTQADVDRVARMPGVACAEGMRTMDVLARRGESEAAVYKLHALPERIDRVLLLGGRMPQAPDECLIDGFHATDDVIGTEITVTQENESAALDALTGHTYTVVGYVSSTLYMDMSRGSTSLGNGSVESYLYLPAEAFRMDYFTEIAVRLDGKYSIYTEAYDQAMTDMAQMLKPDVTVLADDRFVTLRAEGEQAYTDGRQEYEAGLRDYEQGRQETMDALAEALEKLESAQAELDENRQKLEDGQKQLEDGQSMLDTQKKTLTSSRQALLEARAEAYAQFAEGYATLMENYQSVHNGLRQVESGLTQLNSGIAQLENGLAQLEQGRKQLQLVIPIKQAQVDALKAALAVPGLEESYRQQLQEKLEAAQAELTGYQAQAQELQEMQQTYTVQLEELKQQRDTLNQTKAELTDAADQIDMGLVQLQAARVQADDRFAAAEAQLQSGQLQLEQAQAELDEKKVELEAGMQALQAGQTELDAGWAEYEAGKATAEKELADAREKLDDAARQLADARKKLDEMKPAEVYILDRNTNSGYVALDNNSDIVAGVSRVFPAFFLLVAALVCITTMTRMVEEERTQIGTMKALGYGSFSIIRKYLIYAGSAAVLGCGLGVVLGGIAFPTILWQAYGIILHITPKIVLRFDWRLNLAVVAAYTAVMLLVTWYCCRRNLREVPAQLLRPKPPTSGKKLWLEYLPFWKKIGFLNKVMLRNVFRYRQRMFMMLVGIGGCTALLLTGFGLRDSITNIVPEQFNNVTVYDMSVYFSEAQSEQAQQEFTQSLRKELADSLFYYQTSADVLFDGKSRSISLIAADERIDNFMYFNRDGESLGVPQMGEVFLSVGAAEMMDVRVGDSVLLQDSDMRQAQVTVAAIFDNHVYNYAVVRPETLEQAWGDPVRPQMAFLNLRDTADVYATGAKISGMDSVLNVTISDSVRDQVNRMLEALDAIVVLVVTCAGALAAIVLYNLTNINITERIREIATLKVLGFHAWESAAYVFKENLLLSAMGTILGLVGGKFLLEFVISQIKIDMVRFQPNITALSCVVSVLLTMLAACLVDLLLYKKLERINMAEALKSVE